MYIDMQNHRLSKVLLTLIFAPFPTSIVAKTPEFPSKSFQYAKLGLLNL
jgi:hypothetical protein